MSEKNEFPKTLQECVKHFANPDVALAFMVSKRWPHGVDCPHCQSKNVSFVASRRVWQCKGCRKQFSAKVGTIFEDSPIDLGKWFCAFWLIANAKNGISSYEIHRSLGVTQKTGWFMLHRIRYAMQTGSFMKMGGNGNVVEVDETFIGGKARNMHASVKREKNIRTAGRSMTPVMGLLERGTRQQCSRVHTKMLKTRKAAELQGNVREYVLKGSTVNTDELAAYNGLCDEYTHNVINHAQEYVRGEVHTNSLENFWSLLKRSIKGTYVSVEPFHLFRYLAEQSFRFNERRNEDGDQGRFLNALDGVFGKCLRYAHLIGKDSKEGETCPVPV